MSLLLQLWIIDFLCNETILYVCSKSWIQFVRCIFALANEKCIVNISVHIDLSVFIARTEISENMLLCVPFDWIQIEIWLRSAFNYSVRCVIILIKRVITATTK